MLEVGTIYVFGEFRLEAEKRSLSRHGKAVRLAPRPFQVLLYLLENRDRIVTRNELLAQFWDGCEVYDEAVTKCIGAIRKALAEHTDETRFVETRWREGYRFIGQIQEQPFDFTPALRGVEKTRELKIVVEDSENGATNQEKIVKRDTDNLPATPKKFSRRATLAVAGSICLIVAATATFFIARQRQTQNIQPAPSNSIAVLPFKNLSNDAEGDYFSDGMTESLINALSKIENLKVISRSSVFAFQGQDADPREVGKKLGVATVLESSVKENGDKVRVNVRLVNAADGQVLWSSDEYKRALGDIFEIQDDIARSVAAHLRLKLSATDEQRLTRRQTNNVAAYQAYVKGTYFRNKKSKEALAKALEFFQEAIRLDPHYALAYAGLASYYTAGIWYANLPPKEATAETKAAALKALELDSTLSEAHVVRARAAEQEWDWETERKELERAIELDPNNAQAYYAYAFYLSPARPDEALAAIRHAQELDPISPSVNVDVGVMLTRAGRDDEAIATLKKAIELDPQYHDGYFNLARAYERKGLSAEAFDNYLIAFHLSGVSDNRIAAYRAAQARAGIKGFWRQHLEFLQQDAQNRYVTPVELAKCQTRLGERDEAFLQLEKSYAAHDSNLTALNSDFIFASLRPDPRFADLLRRMGLNGQ